VRATTTAALLALGLTLAGCGGDDDALEVRATCPAGQDCGAAVTVTFPAGTVRAGDRLERRASGCTQSFTVPTLAGPATGGAGAFERAQRDVAGDRVREDRVLRSTALSSSRDRVDLGVRRPDGVLRVTAVSDTGDGCSRPGDRERALATLLDALVEARVTDG
jgi:hypothetical protein